MSEFNITSDEIESYCKNHSTPPHPVQVDLTQATLAFAGEAARMQVGHLEGKFLTLLTRLMNAKTVVEFGTFTGYSALAFAEGVTSDGRVTTLDRDPKATSFAREYWNQSPFGSKIELLLGDGHQTVNTLANEIASGVRPQFDLAFIDADKAGYPIYWEACHKLVRKGGAILVDNVLWSGAVLNPSDRSDFVIDHFNKLVKTDVRVEKIMLPIRDGIFLAQII